MGRLLNAKVCDDREKEMEKEEASTQLNRPETAGTMVRKDTLTGTKMHGVRHKNAL